jgi:hypothetical protein
MAALAPLQVEARERGGTKLLRLTVEVAQSARLDLASFREFGPHRVRVECDFGEGASRLLAIDLVAEGGEGSPGAVQTIALTPAARSKEWGYFAASPFRAGYRFRIHAASGDTPAPWSEVQSAGAPLLLKVPVEERATHFRPPGDERIWICI